MHTFEMSPGGPFLCESPLRAVGRYSDDRRFSGSFIAGNFIRTLSGDPDTLEAFARLLDGSFDVGQAQAAQMINAKGRDLNKPLDSHDQQKALALESIADYFDINTELK